MLDGLHTAEQKNFKEGVVMNRVAKVGRGIKKAEKHCYNELESRVSCVK